MCQRQLSFVRQFHGARRWGVKQLFLAFAAGISLMLQARKYEEK